MQASLNSENFSSENTIALLGKKMIETQLNDCFCAIHFGAAIYLGGLLPVYCDSLDDVVIATSYSNCLKG